MIKSFRHKGLEVFHHSGSKKGVRPDHSLKLARILDRLDSSLRPEDMDLPGYKFHSSLGEKPKRWSVWVNGNWRVTFSFFGEDAIQVDYEDYH